MSQLRQLEELSGTILMSAINIPYKYSVDSAGIGDRKQLVMNQVLSIIKQAQLFLWDICLGLPNTSLQMNYNKHYDV